MLETQLWGIIHLKQQSTYIRHQLNQRRKMRNALDAPVCAKYESCVTSIDSPRIIIKSGNIIGCVYDSKYAELCEFLVHSYVSTI